MTSAEPPPVVRLRGVSQRYRGTTALAGVTLDVPAGRMTGLIGPDGAGKSSLLAIAAGARAVQRGEVEALGGDMRQRRHREAVCPRIAYMPQGLGRNLFPSLSVEENLQFFARLFGHAAEERGRRIDELTRSTGLRAFLDRPMGQLSGGMRQKLGLCCALVHDPDLMILDEPTTGVDPLARVQFWELIARIRAARPGTSVVVATAYMDEARRFDWLVAMDGGAVLASGTPEELLARAGARSLEEAFIRLLPEERRRGHAPVVIPPLGTAADAAVAVEAEELTMRFGDFGAVDHVSFRIRRGEIFGFVGSNGCGKTTTMKMLTGLLPASEGRAWLFGNAVDPHDLATRRRVGYMSQGFSLYGELTVRQNLVLHARLFHVAEADLPARVEAMVDRFGLRDVADALPARLPLGMRQRLSLAVAMVHAPELLILDEPTSGVDPIARDAFWRLMIELSRRDGVTIFVSTHFMNEAERCDRISLMHAGRVLASDTPQDIREAQGKQTLEQAFIAVLEAAAGATETAATAEPVAASGARQKPPAFSLRRLLAYAYREMMDLRRDAVRIGFAIFGCMVLMFVLGNGISFDVDGLKFAVLDQDGSPESRDYVDNLAGSRYFVQRPPIADPADLERRIKSGDLSFALSIPPNYGRDLRSGRAPEIGLWVDGSAPYRGETILGYARGMHQQYIVRIVTEATGTTPAAMAADLEPRYRYNQDFRSIYTMVPAIIPLLLIFIPSILMALGVVREKELGSITNLYVTPVTRLEFLLGKQLPYVVLSMISFALLVLEAVLGFRVPLNGSLAALTLGALIYVCATTSLGLFMSSFTRTQIAALFATAILTMLPTVQFSGLTTPVHSLEGAGYWIGELFPASHFLVISRGVFAKALGFADLREQFIALALFPPALTCLSLALLRKQEE